MNNILVSIILITSLMGSAEAFDMENGVEMRPGEAAAENLVYHGIGPAWIGGNPPYSDYYGSTWTHGYDHFDYYGHTGKTYHPYNDPFTYYNHPGKTYHPYSDHFYYLGGIWYPYSYWYPNSYYSDYWWDW